MKYFLSFVLLLFPCYSLACDCNAKPVSFLYLQANRIYLGEVVAVRNLGEMDKSAKSRFGPYAYLIKPTEYFKGGPDRSPSKSVGFSNEYIFESGSECDVFFEVGKKYLVFAKSASWSVFETDQCMGSKHAEYSEKAVKELRILKKSS
jgi:hypothetical protein